MSDRYALLLGPFTVLAAYFAIAACLDAARRRRPILAYVVLASVLLLARRSATTTIVPLVSGFEAVAEYLRAEGPADSVLYSGYHDGIFGFYLRALDPHFERRLVLSGKLLYSYGENAYFAWVETPYVASPADVVSLLRSQSGCRWVAIERGTEWLLPATERHLRLAVEGPEFERVKSFPIRANRAVRVDLYRLRVPVDTVNSIDLVFPSFSSRVFPAVRPINRRR
jgi:hypothetical protein